MALSSLMKGRSFNMIINIKNDDGDLVYDVSKIEDAERKAGASISVSKIGTLNVVTEALNYASQGHQANLEAILNDSPEAMVESNEDEEDVDTTDSK